MSSSDASHHEHPPFAAPIGIWVGLGILWGLGVVIVFGAFKLISLLSSAPVE